MAFTPFLFAAINFGKNAAVFSSPREQATSIDSTQGGMQHALQEVLIE